MPTPRAIQAWLAESEIVNGITNTGFKLDLLYGERSTTAVPDERHVHTSCGARTSASLHRTSTGSTGAGSKTPPSLRERKVHTSCSERTSAALRKQRYSPGWSPESKPSEGSSRQTCLPFTPDGVQSFTGTNFSGLTPLSSGPTPDVSTGLSVLKEGSGPLERILQPVLLAKASEHCLGPPGAPPRRAGGLRRLCVRQKRASPPPEEHKEPQQAPPSSNRSMPSRWKPWPGATPSPGPSSWAATSAESESMYHDDDDLSELPSELPRTQTPAFVRETIYASQVFGNKGCIFRETFDKEVNKIKQDEKDFALRRREVEKAAKDSNRASVVKWATVHRRQQQVYELRALASDPEVRRALIPEDAPCDGNGGHTTPNILTQKELAEMCHYPGSVEMPATIYAQDTLCTTEEEHAAATKLKKKQNLQARLRKLKRIANERRQNEVQDVEADLLHAFLERQSKKSRDRPVILEINAPKMKVETSPLAGEDQSTSSPSRNPGLKERRRAQDELTLNPSISEKGNEGNEAPPSPNMSARALRRQQMTDKMNAIRQRAFSDQVEKYRERELLALKEVFGWHDHDGNSALDHEEVRSCLASLGIIGKNQKERQALRNVLWHMDKLLFDLMDLSEILVPSMRKKLREVRQPRLLELFQSMDRHARKKLSIEDALSGLRRLGMVIRDEIQDRVVEMYCFECHGDWVPSYTEPILSPSDFVVFFCILGEQADRHKAELLRTISGKLRLSGELFKDWQHDLVDLYCQFHEYDPVCGKYGSSSGKLTEQEFKSVVLASGYMPKTRARQVGLKQSFHEIQRADGTIGFDGFLSIMRRLRDYDRERLWRVLENWLHDGVVNYSDICEMLPDCGVICRNAEEEKEVRAMMEEHDEDGLGIFSAQEVIPLLQQMCKRMRNVQHERERQYVLSAGWSQHNFVEFRQAFQVFDEDMSEYLDCDELLKAVELLRGSYWQSQQNLDMMLLALGVDTSDTSREIKVNFFTFLRMMKMLDESETRRQQGLSIGLSRDRTDVLYHSFQALEHEGDGTLSRQMLEKIMIGLSGGLTKAQIQDLARIIEELPLQIGFSSFLRVMKALDGAMIAEVDLEALQQGQRKAQKIPYTDFADFAKSAQGRVEKANDERKIEVDKQMISHLASFKSFRN